VRLARSIFVFLLVFFWLGPGIHFRQCKVEGNKKNRPGFDSVVCDGRCPGQPLAITLGPIRSFPFPRLWYSIMAEIMIHRREDILLLLRDAL